MKKNQIKTFKTIDSKSDVPFFARRLGGRSVSADELAQVLGAGGLQKERAIKNG